MELDLNEKPVDRTEEQMKRLEAILKAKQTNKKQKCYTPIQITNFAGELLIKTDNVQEDESKVTKKEVEGGTSECEKTRKRKASCLVAKALGMETSTDGVAGRTRNFFDCNICLDMAIDAVLTCCGHLFCWECFYQLPYAYSNAKECPVCAGEVVDADVIPVYGNGRVDDSGRFELKESGLTVPSRPYAPRVESTRQRRRRRTFTSTNHDLSLFGNFGGLEEPDPLQLPIISND
jgi:E3 ubiquitin-protein ligase RNF5